MQFIRASSGEGEKALAVRLRGELMRGKRVVWFFSGGSNIPITVRVMQDLPDKLTELLTIIPVDERYGAIGHTDSNTSRLFQAGLALKQAVFVPVLDGSDITTTTERFGMNVDKALTRADTAIGQLGIGPDGHTSGILPHSEAVASSDVATHYQGPDFARITTTFPTLRRLTAAYVFAYGDGKHTALEQLRDDNLPLGRQPAQILKTLPEVYVYNDQLEENKT